MSIWGKLIGGTAGFALGGPIGAILGMIVGGSLDRSIKRLSTSTQLSPENKQKIFVISIIILSAKIAKADGKVTKDEIYAFKEKFKIPESEMPEVGKIFNEAKKSKDGFEKIANQVGTLFFENKALLEELLNNLFYIAESDGDTSKQEIKVLKSISNSFRLSENDFQRILHSRLKNKEADPFKVLGVNRDASDTIIRKKWIQLNKEHHPDHLFSKGLPQEFVDQSNNELSSINLAYDKIKKLRDNS
jgi:DnaJ like chaperone protein